MNESLDELMTRAFHLAMDVAYSELAPGGHWIAARQEALGTEDETDMVWSWADGHQHKHLHDRTSGRCSLQAMIDFDIGRFEEQVRRDIVTLTQLLARFGAPKPLDFSEMKRRGYRGEWAGESEA
jgi:hypothetical protein